MIDDEEITENDDYNPKLNEVLKDACHVVEQAIDEVIMSTKPLDVVMWFGLRVNISIFDKGTGIRQSTYRTKYDTAHNIRELMERMKRTFSDDERHYGYFGWSMTLDDLQELQDWIKKQIQAPFV